MSRQELFTIPCPLCGSDELALFCEDSEMTYRRCAGCGLVFLNPRAHSQSFNKDSGAARDEEGSPAALSDWSLPRIKGFLKGAELIRSRVRIGRLLDIGCGDGRFLSIMQGLSELELHGLEPNSIEAARASSLLGIEVFPGTLEDAEYEGGYFDVVTMWDVLEHVDDPVKELREVRRILHDGGLLLARIPNLPYFRLKQRVAGKYMRSRGMTIYNPRHHFTYLDRDTARMLLERTGFAILSLRPSRSEYGMSNARLAAKTGYHFTASLLYALTFRRVILTVDLLILARPASA
ncbi:MAG: class I SAM-dependent methyltransferase [Actinobacteria bacterium]|nr:class I SAM-dependent methyltransferase [Actinomycetota bacterium]